MQAALASSPKQDGQLASCRWACQRESQSTAKAQSVQLVRPPRLRPQMGLAGARLVGEGQGANPHAVPRAQSLALWQGKASCPVG